MPAPVPSPRPVTEAGRGSGEEKEAGREGERIPAKEGLPVAGSDRWRWQWRLGGSLAS